MMKAMTPNMSAAGVLNFDEFYPQISQIKRNFSICLFCEICG